jgi:hypothetical protein
MAKLTTQKRKDLKKSSFAVPSKRAYPIENVSHARNALARVSQFGSPAEKAEVRSAVHKKFPQIGVAKKVAKHPADYEKDYSEMRSGKRSRF